METTQTDPRSSLPAFSNQVVQLREWGSETIYALPTPTLLPPCSPEAGSKSDIDPQAWLVGASSQCHVQIRDETRRTSRLHARLIFDKSQWSLLDLGSKNGIRVDGKIQATSYLGAGQEIQIGGVTLVAESPRLIGLRRLVSRLIGWHRNSDERVDLALRAIRSAEARRLPLYLRGEGDLVPVALQLHRWIVGTGVPFVLCDRRRQSTLANVRSVPNERSLAEAMRAAKKGTLCLRWNRLPAEYEEALRAFQEGDSLSYLIICGGKAVFDAKAVNEPLTISLPSLSSRGTELKPLIEAYLDDAAERMKTEPIHDEPVVEWILRHSSRTLYDIEKGTRRLTALALCDSTLQSAAALGMTAVSLRRWFERRGGAPKLPWRTSIAIKELVAEGFDDDEFKDE